MSLPNGIKKVCLPSGEYLYFWYANNKGRGWNIVTIIRTGCPVRAAMSAKQQDIIAVVRTLGWAGNVNFSRAVLEALGL